MILSGISERRNRNRNRNNKASECGSIQCHFLPKPSGRTIATRRRSNKTMQKIVVMGVLVVMAIVDLFPTSIVTNNNVFGTRKVAFGFSSSSHQERRSSLLLQGVSRKIPQEGVPNKNSRSSSSGTIVVLQAVSSSSSSSDGKHNPFLVRLLTGEKKSSARLRRPKWLQDDDDESSKLSLSSFLPTWLFHLRPSVQLLATIILYLFHTAVLTQTSLVLPIQLFPNDRGNFQSIGLDT